MIRSDLKAPNLSKTEKGQQAQPAVPVDIFSVFTIDHCEKSKPIKKNAKSALFTPLNGRKTSFFAGDSRFPPKATGAEPQAGFCGQISADIALNALTIR